MSYLSPIRKILEIPRFGSGMRFSHCVVNEYNKAIVSRIDDTDFIIVRQNMPDEAWWLVANKMSKNIPPIGPFDTPERAYAQLRLLGS